MLKISHLIVVISHQPMGKGGWMAARFSDLQNFAASWTLRLN